MIEVLEGRSGRRLRSVAELARIRCGQVYDWRRKLRSGALTMPAAAMREPMFAALVVEHPEPAPPGSQRKGDGEARSSRIELLVEGVVL